MKKNTFVRLSASFISLIIVAICVYISYANNYNIPGASYLGVAVTIPLITIILYKFPIRLYMLALLYGIISVPFGTILTFYGKYPGYDKFIHFISGVILADLGFFVISYLSNKKYGRVERVIALLFTVLFSTACAGVWEIYEYGCDQLIHTLAQGGLDDTMGDIIAGTLGAILYLLTNTVIHKIREKRKNPNVL